MKLKIKIKMGIDFMITVLLLLLMTYQITGQVLHEWLGVGMLVLFLLHNILNIKWYGNLFKGKYTLLRVMQVITNISVLASMLCLGFSGIVMSRHVFAVLSIRGPMATARTMHMAAAYWGFVLMSIHLGFHWSMVLGVFHRLLGRKKTPAAFVWMIRFIAIFIAGYGAYCFHKQNIVSYMFLKQEFVFFDFEQSAVFVFAEYIAMMGLWVFISFYAVKGISKITSLKKGRRHTVKKISAFILAVVMLFALCAFGKTDMKTEMEFEKTTVESTPEATDKTDTTDEMQTDSTLKDISENFVLIPGGTFQMGSPEDEAWRSEDEAQHTVTVSDFYMSIYELTQAEYQEIMGENPSSFSGDDLPVENVPWLDAIRYCNARSEKEGLTPAYTIDGQTITWNRSADGYRLPTEAEWEYACRAGTTTPFNTERSISAEEANYYGHYSYEIEDNYFSQENLTTKPGEYRQTTVAVDSFSPNAWGLYNMHGNVSEWVWDYYGAYDTETPDNPTGAITGTLRVYRGGGWNDFAKNMRSAYRATLAEDKGSFNIGIRLVRGFISGSESVASTGTQNVEGNGGNVLIAYFSWGGNTRGIAEEIQSQTGADLFEIELVNPYSSDYNTVLDEAQRDQNEQARPEFATHVENMDDYDTILLGYPNWWASIPMPIASFLEEYDFSGKTIIPFCSHGGGRFGQSLTAIAKLAPNAAMGEALSIHYSGGSTLPDDITEWLKSNSMIE